MNQLDVMVVKAKGSFVWHKHDDSDDFFPVIRGRLTIQLRDSTVMLNPATYSWFPKGWSTVPPPRKKFIFF